MAAHRYWRAIGLEAYGATGLDITEFQLLAVTTRVDASATLTSNIAPATGSLANLKDDDTSTGATWPAADLKTLVLSWDLGLGGDQDVTDIRIGAAVDTAKFLLVARMQGSDDGVTWSESYTYTGIVWPGPSTKTASVPRGVWNRFDAAGAWSIDSTGAVLTAVTATQGGARSRSAASSGVRQFEVVVVGAMGVLIGVTTKTATLTLPGGDASGWMFIINGPLKYTAGVSTAYGTVAVSGDVIGVVVDFGAGSVTFFRNGVSLGVAFTGLSGSLFPVAGINVVGSRTLTLKTSGTFAFPIAGATAWDATYEVQYSAMSRSAAPHRIASAMTLAYSFGAMRLTGATRGRRDFMTGVLGQGVGRVRGSTLDYELPTNKPCPCRVRLIRESDGYQLREQWSAADGSYDFQYVDEMQSYTVAAYYLDHGKRAVIADGITLANGKVEVMP